jgi:hypothetical protein
MPTEKECKSLIFKAGIKYGVSPTLISTKLLSKQDKNDMLEGSIDRECLETAVRIWIAAGIPDWVRSELEPLQQEIEKSGQ